MKNVSRDAALARRREIGIAPTAPVVAVIGRFHPVKGQKGMLEIMMRVVRSCPAAMLVFVGDGSERRECEQLANSLGLTRSVIFLGQRDDVPELLAASDVVAVPSLSEGFGLVAIEGHAAGRPVVAYSVGGLPEVVTDGVDGTLVKLGDQDAFAAAVVTLLRESGLRQRYGEAGRANAERFSLERHVAALLQIYREAVPAA
jgi:glycosyltransferase involved in cell wall biosynthesis